MPPEAFDINPLHEDISAAAVDLFQELVRGRELPDTGRAAEQDELHVDQAAPRQAPPPSLGVGPRAPKEVDPLPSMPQSWQYVLSR